MGLGSLLKKIPLKFVIKKLSVAKVLGFLVKKGGRPEAETSVIRLAIILIITAILILVGESELGLQFFSDNIGN